MLRRAVALCAVPVLVIAATAVAGQLPLSTQLLTAANISFSGSVPTDALTFEDPTGDIYHPLGSPGITDGSIDITRLEMSAWAVGIAEALEGRNPFAMDLDSDGIKRGGQRGDFAAGSPYVVAGFQLDGDPSSFPTRFCEFPLAWANPLSDVFQGIDGDLFNGTNSVTVARMGEGVPNGFQVRSLEFRDGLWSEMEPIGYAAYSDSRLVFAIPADRLGPASAGLLALVRSFARGGGEATETSVDFNFGSFCSEGGQTFVASEGGVDILQTPVDLAGLPVTIIGAPEAPTPTTEAPPAPATPTTLDETPVTSVPPEEEETNGGGFSPILVGLIAGGIAGAVLAGVKKARGKSDAAGGAARVRLAFDGGPSGSFTGVSGLDLNPGPIEYRDGLEVEHTRKQPGISKNALITLKRGTVDDSAAFLEVFRDDQKLSGSIAVAPPGGPELRWKFEQGWPGKWTGPGLNAANNEVAFETMELHVEGLQLDVGR